MRSITIDKHLSKSSEMDHEMHVSFRRIPILLAPLV